MEQIHYVIYKITNLLNGMIYIGQHTTTNPNDGYMGSGKYITRAIKKYGVENFKKEILFECSSQEELNAKELELVNEEFVKRTDTYNLVLGGIQGLSHEQAVEFGRMGQRKLQESLKDLDKREEFYKKIGQHTKQLWSKNPEIYKHRNGFLGGHHTEDSKNKLREKAKLRVGEKNSIFGRIWVYNELVQHSTTIDKKELHDYMEQGWEVGRIISWDSYFSKKQRDAEIAKRRLNRCIFKSTRQNDSSVDPELEHRIEYYKKLLPLFLHNRWKRFVELSGYKYSNQNFYYQINVYLGLSRQQLKEMKNKTLQEIDFNT